MGRVALVVDDSMLIRHTVCRFLEERGFAVESACDGVEALEMLAHLRPDVIITDLQMPKMGGAELILALKNQAETSLIPILVLAAKRSDSQSLDSDTRAQFVIYKDIDMQKQLEKAVTAVCA